MSRAATLPMEAVGPMHRNLRAMVDGLSRHAVLAILLTGWLHSAASRLPDIWGTGADAGPAGPVGPLELLILAIAIAGTLQVPVAIGLGRAAFAAAAVLLLPSTLSAEAATLVFAVWAARQTQGQARAGVLLFAGLAACGLWWIVGERIIGAGMLNVDAMAVQAVLGSLVPDIERVGNVVGIANGHRIVVFAGCSTLNALPLIVLGVTALSLRQGRLTPTFWRRVLAVSAIYAVANLLRLTLLATSAQLYHVGHGPWGMMTFDAVATLLPLWLAARPEPATGRMPPLAPRRSGTLPAWRPLALAALLIAGLAALAHQLASPVGPSREALAKQAVTAFLVRQGWQVLGQSNISSDGTTTAIVFVRPGCNAPLMVAVVGRGNEAASMVQAAFGPQTRWLYEGRMMAAAPIAQQTMRDLWSAAELRLGLIATKAMPLLAITQGQSDRRAACTMPPDDAWQVLTTLDT